MLPVRENGDVTVSVIERLSEPIVALIVAVPLPTPVASPAPLMLATLGAEEFHVTEAVRF